MSLKDKVEITDEKAYIIASIVIVLLLIIFTVSSEIHERCDRIEAWLSNERVYKQEYRSYDEYVDEWCEMKYWEGRDPFDE